MEVLLADLTDIDPVTRAAFRSLYQDNTELLRERRELRQANFLLVQANDALLLRVGAYCRSSSASLPPEILLKIFRDALPPPWLLAGAESLPSVLDILAIDSRMKLSLIGVCKSWNRVATELLYERVALHRITQLAVFVRALEDQVGLGALVRHLDIHSFVPRGYFRFFETATQRVLELCPRLIHIGFSPPCSIPDLPCSFPVMSSSLPRIQPFCTALRDSSLPHPACCQS
ncbi:hypothetical protein B0H16DRAFT_558601 [Mycena metata]|uniref:F-box domain-containing protein n=1 Tax=Mycena metata TaxID=1033252 RepID=A0AAD7JCL2_9AGAR|nr:hypothetical protein B0H16DRAFT_558601 [Mycena metata]